MAVSVLVTITEDPLGLTMIEVGAATAIVAFTAPVAVSMTVTVLLVELDTYSLVPSCFTATPSGAAPTVEGAHHGRGDGVDHRDRACARFVT